MTDIIFKDWFLSESPINNFQLSGKWNPHDKPRGYNKQDVSILTNPKAVDKIHKIWSNTKQKFDLYFLRSPQADKFVQIGVVTPEWVKENLKIDVQPNPDSISVIFTQNQGTEKIPMTGWMIAHRLGHALINDNRQRNGPLSYFFNRVLKDFTRMTRILFPDVQPSYNAYGTNQPNQVSPIHLAYAVGTMKSVRERNLTQIGDFAFELFAQYLLTGKVKFNPLPRSIIRKNTMAWGRANPQTSWIKNDNTFYLVHNELEQLPQEYEDLIEEALSGLEGTIIVM